MISGTNEVSVPSGRATVKIPASTNTAEIVQVGGHYAVQGHSRSSILVPIESPYATSY